VRGAGEALTGRRLDAYANGLGRKGPDIDGNNMTTVRVLNYFHVDEGGGEHRLLAALLSKHVGVRRQDARLEARDHVELALGRVASGRVKLMERHALQVEIVVIDLRRLQQQLARDQRRM